MAAPRGYRASSYGWDAHYDATQYDHEDYMTYDNWQLKLEQGDAPTDMVVDGLYPEVEKDDVAIIDPDQLDSTDIEMPDRLRADDYEAMKDVVLPTLVEEPEILADAIHTWHIKDWRRLPRREHGPVFEAGGHPWRVLLFPAGNNVDQASFYLEQGYSEADGGPPEDFVCCAQFGLVLWNRNDPTIFHQHTAHHRFTKEEGDWGFTRFLELRRLFGPWEDGKRSLIENDEVMMTAYVRVVKDETGVLWHNFNNYDSKKETGYVGLRNQGATCYLNSLIQSLYLTHAFRKAVYQIPTQDEEAFQNSAYTLQRLFYMLQTSTTAVSTLELTKSFGWETRHIFEQQDVQELSRKLMERMEEKMKGTEAEGALANMFSGKVQTYVSCINVEYESRRVEEFWDIQLNVAGQEDVLGAFKDYVQVEIMDGENKYMAGDEYKLQDAKKGVIFESFPDVLNLQLKRFQYDVELDAMAKINTRFEYPEIFDASPFLADDADKSEPYTYQLHSVLVHSGDLNAGHYYAFIRPNKDGWFYRFDDDKVTKATIREVLEENYGGRYPLVNGQIHTNQRGEPLLRTNSAYMLVYIRQSRVDKILQPVSEEETPPHLQKRLQDEETERIAKRKEREEAPLFTNVRVITDTSFRAYSGFDLGDTIAKPDDSDPAIPKVYRVLKKSPLLALQEKIAKDIDQDPRCLRLWGMVNRQNKTTRPDAPIYPLTLTIEEVQSKVMKTDLKLWVEVAEEVTPEGEPVWLAHPIAQNGNVVKSDIIVLFLKHFDVETQSLIGVGHIYISREKKVEDIAPAIMKKMNWPEKTQIKLWEEIKPSMVEAMKSKMTLKAAELQDGDIICFQRIIDPKTIDSRSSESSSDQSVSHLSSQLSLADLDGSTLVSSRSPTSSVVTLSNIEDAAQFYDYLLHRRVVKFQPHPRNSNGLHQEIFELGLSNKELYARFAAKVGERLHVLPTHLRFWTINATNGNPKSVVKHSQTQTLLGAFNSTYNSFSNSNQRQDALAYEVLDMSLAELETKRPMRIIWLCDGVTKEEQFEILVPKTGTVVDLINGLLKKAGLEDEAEGGQIRVFEVSGHKVHKELPRDHNVQSITDYVQLMAERIPQEELDNDRNAFIHAFHYHQEPSKAHGVPFKFHIKPDEKWSDTKVRLEKRTGLKGKKFEKIKFTVVKKSAYSKVIPLADDDVLWNVAGNDDDLLGLDHADSARSIRNGAGDLFLK